MLARRECSRMVISGLPSCDFLGHHLLHLFMLYGSLPDTKHAFCSVSKPSIYTWNAIISEHVKLGQNEKALALYHRMQSEGFEPDRVTFLCSLKACSSIQAIGHGRTIHNQIISNELDSDLVVGNTLVSMYAKCGSLKEACAVFDILPNQDVVSWGAMLAGYVQHGHGQIALELFERMLEEEIKPNKVIFLCILKACGNTSGIGQGRLIHGNIIAHGLESDLVIGNSLIHMYAKCRSLEDARKLFDILLSRDLVSYSAMISGYVEQNQNSPALDLFDKLLEDGIKPNSFIVICILRACCKAGATGKGRQIHNQIYKGGLESDVVVGNNLVGMYAKCGSLREARTVFDGLPNRDVVSWGAIITEHTNHGHGLLALELFDQMQEEGIKPNKVIILCVLKACSSIQAIYQGKAIHDQIVRGAFDSDVVVGSTIVDMYAKCGSLEEAHEVFAKMPIRNVVSWGALIAGYAQHGHGSHALELLKAMQDHGVDPDNVIYLSILKACGRIQDIWQGRSIHERIIRCGSEVDVLVGNALVDMYAKCGNLEEAYEVLEEMKNRDVISWGAVIAASVEQEHGFCALELFAQMKQEGIKPNKVIYSCVLKACSSTDNTGEGRSIHEQIIRSGLESDVVVGSTLIDMYAKSGCIGEAREVFDRLSDRNVISWGAMITGYAQHGCSLGAFEFLEEMQKEGLKPNEVTFSCILKACGGIGSFGQGRFIHDLIAKEGLESDVYVGSSLVDMYAKCGKLEEARNVFDKLLHRNSVSWGAMITGYALHGHGLPVLNLFGKMGKEAIQPSKVTFLSVLKACGSIGVVGQGRQVHVGLVKSGLEIDVVVGNALIDMYANCGSIEDACKVFDILLTRDIVSWGAMIAAYAHHGSSVLARQCLKDMQKDHLVPDAVIFTSGLMACTQAGLLEEGCWFFNSMKHDHGIIPSIEHYNCLVDLLGRAGKLTEAEGLLRTMPIPPDVIGWRSLLTACRTYGNMWLGRQCFDQFVQLDGNDASGYMLMSYLYADAHMWENVENFRELRKCAFVPKKPGTAWIEVQNELHEFVVGGQIDHHHSVDISSKLTRLSMPIKEEGGVPILDLVFDVLSLEL